MIQTLLSFLLTFCIVSSTYQSSDTLRTDLQTKHSRVLTFNITYSQEIVYNSTLIGSLSLYTFSSLTSINFNFKLVTQQIQKTFIFGSISNIEISYFTKMSIQYIVSTNNHQAYRIVLGCYPCADLLSGSGQRTQIISIANPQTSFTNTSIGSAITGVKISNDQSSQHFIKVISQVVGSYLKHHVTTSEYNIVSSICLVTFIINHQDPNILIHSYFAEININNLEASYSNQFSMADIPTRYQGQNRCFFGINTILMQLQSSNREIQMSIQNITNSSVSSSIIQVYYTSFYFAEVNCSNQTQTLIYDYQSESCLSSCLSGFVNMSNYCNKCHKQCSDCDDITRENCTTCSLNLTLSNGYCICQPGDKLKGKDNNLSCSLCSQAMIGCTQCEYLTTCTLCSSQFQLNATNGQCYCANNLFLAQKYCIQFPGCKQVNDTNLICLQCDNASYFQINQNNTCDCIQGFSLNVDYCQPICGDGTSLGNQCDDNNTNDLDGCSSNCTIEDQYYCFSTIQGSISQCVPKFQIYSEVVYIKRIPNSNCAQIVLRMNKSHEYFNKINFAQNLDTSIPYDSISYSYDHSNRLLSLIFQYTRTIQADQHNLQISFNRQEFYSDPISLNLTTIGVNYMLTFDENIELIEIVGYVAMSISGMSFLLGLLCSLLNEKLIGLQLLLPIQITFFSSLYLQSNGLANNIISQLQYSKSYNQVVSYDYMRLYTLSGTNITQLFEEAEFLLNYNFMFALHLLIIILLAILTSIVYCLEQEPLIEDPRLKKIRVARAKSVKNAKNFVADRIYFFITVCVTLQVNFAVILEFFLLKTQSSQQVLPKELNYTASIFAQGLVIGSYMYFYNDFANFKTIQYHSFHPKYGLHFVLSYFVMGCFLSMLYNIEMGIAILLLLSLLPTFLIVKMCPYSGQKINMFGGIYCQLVMCFSIAYYMLTKFMTLDSNLSLYCTLGILAMIILAVLLTILRLILAVGCCQNGKKGQDKFKSLKNLQDNMNEQFLQSSSSARQAMLKGIKIPNMHKYEEPNCEQLEHINNEQQSNKQKPSTPVNNQGKVIQASEQEPKQEPQQKPKQKPDGKPMTELQQLKARLRNQLKSKWG